MSGRGGKGGEKATRARPAAAAARASDTPPPRAWRWGAPATASTRPAHDAPGRGRRRLRRRPTRAARALAQTVATIKSAAGGVDSPSGCPSVSPPTSPLRAASGRRQRRCPPIEGVPLPTTVFEEEVERKGGTRRGRRRRRQRRALRVGRPPRWPPDKAANTICSPDLSAAACCVAARPARGNEARCRPRAHRARRASPSNARVLSPPCVQPCGSPLPLPPAPLRPIPPPSPLPPPPLLAHCAARLRYGAGVGRWKARVKERMQEDGAGGARHVHAAPLHTPLALSTPPSQTHAQTMTPPHHTPNWQ